MNVAREKTDSIIRKDIPVSLLDVNELNPNRMSDAEFNMLCDNFEKTGFTDALLVRALPNGRYRVVGGHHRLEAAKLYDFEEVPCTVITDPNFDDDAEAFQVVRMNVIRGKMTPDKFLKLYSTLSMRYTDEIMQEAFGFVEEEEFRKLIKSMSKALPQEHQAEYIEAASELKTIEGLSKLLNTMFTKYGDTLPYGYMVLDYGGKDSVWLRMGQNTKKAVQTIGTMCINENRTIDAIVGGVLQLIADGKLSNEVLQLIAESPVVKIPENFKGLPTADKVQ